MVNKDFFKDDGLLNDWTMKHLDTWLEHYFVYEQQEFAKTGILSFLKENPELLERGYSWIEIYNLYNRQK